MSLQCIKQTSPLHLAFIIKLCVHMLMPSVFELSEYFQRMWEHDDGNEFTICQRSSKVLFLSATVDSIEMFQGSCVINS